MKFDEIDSPNELLNFMNENIKYGFIGKNKKIYTDPSSKEWDDWYEECIVQTGKQVLESKIGTCWDQVELERLWFLNKKYDIKTIFIWFETNCENNYPTHTFLLYKKDNNWYWFEHSFFDFRGIHEFSSYEEAIDYVIKKHLNYAIKNNVAKLEDKKIIVSYEYKKLEKSLTVDEFLEHVTKKI